MSKKFAINSDGYTPGLDDAFISKFQRLMKEANNIDDLDDGDVINNNIMRAIQDQSSDFAKGSMDNSAEFPESTRKET